MISLPIGAREIDKTPLLLFVFSKEEQVFKKYFPETSIPYCLHLWKVHGIQFTISRPRKTVYGVYRYKNGTHHISVNGDLNPHAFLVTYLHEVAHLMVRTMFRVRVQPHGKEWQKAFQDIMKPVLNETVFPAEILTQLETHLRKPSATTCSDALLYRLLMQSDALQKEQIGLIAISALAEKARFTYQGKQFIRLRQLRKRIECMLSGTGTLYRFHPEVLVRKDENKGSDQRFYPEMNPIGDLKPGDVFRSQGRNFKCIRKENKRVVANEIGSGAIFAFPIRLHVELLDLGLTGS